MFILSSSQARVGVDNAVDDDDHDTMKTAALIVVVLGLILASPAAFAHEGHGATPAHVHHGAASVDVGAAGFALFVGALLLGAARGRAVRGRAVRGGASGAVAPHRRDQ
jgi:hypothetical protein